MPSLPSSLPRVYWSKRRAATEGGWAANAGFVDGVAVFVRPAAGAMAEASLGRQRTTYVAK